ncbi:MAG: TetR-like C-terminal domain-containing protein [Chloroflexota bacterium]
MPWKPPSTTLEEAILRIAYRQWALDHPADFELIYGNPMLELFNHTRSLVNDPDAFYRHELYSRLNSLIKHLDQN